MAYGDTVMTTPINNFQDILDAMERDPALRDAMRRQILMEELLRVPVRLDRIEGDIGILKEGQARLEERVGTIETDVGTIKEDVSALKEGQARLEGGQARLEEGQARLEERVDRIGGDVSRLTGADYESHVAIYIPRFLRRNLGMKATVFATQRDNAALTRLLDDAESQGLIRPEDTDEVDQADLVLTADGPTDYLLAEVSVTVQQDDVDRAAERAGLLAKATGRTVAPFAIGSMEEPDLRRGHVQVLLIPERQST